MAAQLGRGRLPPNSWQTIRKRSSRPHIHPRNRLRRKLQPKEENPHPKPARCAGSSSGKTTGSSCCSAPTRSASCAEEEGPVALDNDLVKRYKEKFGPAILEAWTDRKQTILVVARELLAEIALYSRDDEKFDWLSDLTAVDWPKREKRFDIVLLMYSFEKKERLRLKVHASEDERVPQRCRASGPPPIGWSAKPSTCLAWCLKATQI